MNRKEFDETFAGRDLTIQVRAALDFAQQNGLAFGRSMGDQYFVFSRLSAAAPDSGNQQRKQPSGKFQRSRQRSHGRSRRRRG